MEQGKHERGKENLMGVDKLLYIKTFMQCCNLEGVEGAAALVNISLHSGVQYSGLIHGAKKV